MMSDRQGRTGPDPTQGRRSTARRSPALRRRVLLGIVAAAGLGALGTGLVVGSAFVPMEIEVAERFGAAWTRGDIDAMYDELTAEARDRVSAERFGELYDDASETATVVRLRTGAPVSLGEGRVEIPVTVATRIFGTIRSRVELVVLDEDGIAGVDWRRHLVFPGMNPGEELERTTRLPPRADILARDKTPLAEGPDRTSGVPDVALNVVGRLGPAPPERAAELRALGVPQDAKVGINGLERILDARLIGTPGGTLEAGGRTLAETEPVPADPVRTTISVDTVRTAVQQLGGRLGGVAAIAPRTGEILAFAGIAFSGLQPPGSTMKIITLAGGLEAGITEPGRTYPVETHAVLEGVTLENANGELCGGTLENTFAHSCNSVFAPMGAELGAERLVETAERFGFNEDPGIPGAATPTIPAPEEIGDDLAVGASAIGQGRVQATALTMAHVAATIANDGRRPELHLVYDPRERAAPTTRATSAKIAETITDYMVAVVREGTGALAAIEGIRVAGKTGTAELESTQRCEAAEDNPESCIEKSDETDTDAWFASFAPAGDPEVAVGVLLVRSGSGGDNAAPVAREVMETALGR